VSKTPDLSAFPIPRKGGARPIEADEVREPNTPLAALEEEAPPAPAPPPALVVAPARMPTAITQEKHPTQRTFVEDAAAPTTSGQVVATTVKLDENRYLRLAEAGRPGPGRLKRRTIQEMVVEALDEWFEKRGF